MTMESLLTQAFKFESTNPLDKVYGLLGLVGNCPDLDPIVPDYRKFMMEVYAQATFFAIKQELSLELLCCGNLNTPTDTECEGNENSLANLWPSWVPRYDLDTSKTTIANFVPAANAHNDFEAIVSLSSSIPFTLQAHGLSLGKITKLRKAPSEILDTNMFEGHKDVFRYFSYLWDPDFVASKNLAWSEDLVTTIAASLVCGHYGSEGWNPYQDAETDPVVARRFAAFMFAIKETAPSIPDFPQLRKLLESCGTPEEDDAALFAKDVKYIAQKFVHLELEDGRFGIGSQVCREGDEVSILFGAKEPFVMRRVGEYYRLLGPGYVARVMKVSTKILRARGLVRRLIRYSRANTCRVLKTPEHLRPRTESTRFDKFITEFLRTASHPPTPPLTQTPPRPPLPPPGLPSQRDTSKT